MPGKRLAIITPVFPPYCGGMGTVAQRHAALFAKRGYAVQVYTPKYPQDVRTMAGMAAPPAVEQCDGYTIQWVAPTFSHGNAGHIDLTEAFANNDIVHLHFPFYFSSEHCIGLRKQFPDKKFFITYHMDPIAHGLKGLFFRLYSWLMTPKILAAADAVFVSARDYAQAASNGAYFRAHADQVVEVPFGVDTERFFPDHDHGVALRSRMNLVPDMPVILFVGGMDTPHYFKGVPVLLEAFALVTEPAQLAIVGDGDLRAQFVAQAQQSGKQDFIHFVGSVTPEELPQWYRAADMFVLASTNRSEAFGLVLLEAMASGVACIASDIPGVSSVLAQGKSGLLFPAGDIAALASAIDTLVRDKNKRAQLVAAGLTRVSSLYTWPRMADQYESCYTSF